MEIITQAEARERGLTRYFTGIPCPIGHISPRNTKARSCIECDRIKMAEYRAKNPDKFAGYESRRGDRSEYAKARYAKNREASIASVLKWRNENRDRFNETRSKWQRERFAKDSNFALELRVRGAINDALRNRGFTKRARASEILDCSWDEFRAHLERQFLTGMTWENRHLWHIDHIVPMSTAVTEADVLALNHFTNLRPLWARDNLAKRDKITHLI